ncbi:MAG: hypothetical protein KA508_02960 [Gammaproteobacteria bacterium]|nr:hypothetical protein [Gammaproteobacteria bacterium]
MIDWIMVERRPAPTLLLCFGVDIFFEKKSKNEKSYSHKKACAEFFRDWIMHSSAKSKVFLIIYLVVPEKVFSYCSL